MAPTSLGRRNQMFLDQDARRGAAVGGKVVLEPVFGRGAPGRCLGKGHIGDAGSVQLAARAVEDRQWHDASHGDRARRLDRHKDHVCAVCTVLTITRIVSEWQGERQRR